MGMNNINLEGMKSFAEEVKQDLAKSKRIKKIECSWNFDERKPQMTSKLQHPKGETTVHSDLAPFMGGTGSAPDPIQYCLFGLACCFAGTFMSTALSNGRLAHLIRPIQLSGGFWSGLRSARYK